MEKPAKKVFQTEVNQKICKACGYCKEVCPCDVFESSGHLNTQGYEYMVAAHAQQCIGCLKCLMICPDFAITVEEQ